MATSTFVAVVNVAGLTRMLHCFVGWAEFANPASDIATMAVRNVIHVRKLFMRISQREFRRRSAQDAIPGNGSRHRAAYDSAGRWDSASSLPSRPLGSCVR